MREIRHMKQAAILLLMLCLMGCGVIVTPEPPPTPTPFVMQSLFAGDTCAPPCWFGLTPGVSTAADAYQLMIDSASASFPQETFGITDTETGYLSSGLYEFNLALSETSTLFAQIHIRNGIVYLIRVYPIVQLAPGLVLSEPTEEHFTLGEVLDAFGSPDLVYYSRGLSDFNDGTTLNLTYLESFVRIQFMTAGAHAGCGLRTIREDLAVEFVNYYSQDAAQELRSSIGHNEPQPVFTDYGFNQQNLPLEAWEHLLTADDLPDTRCFWIIQFLTPRETEATLITTTNPEESQSLFADDTCAPPCWFGLTPGESTFEDIEPFMRTNSQIFRSWEAGWRPVFDPQTGNVSDGRLIVPWIMFQREDTNAYGNRIDLIDGDIVSIRAVMNRTMLLQEVLERLGQPDFIAIISGIDNPIDILELSYFRLRLRVTLFAVRCDLRQIGNAFWVVSANYYSQESFEEERFVSDSLRQIPIELWQSWLNGEVTGSCLGAWSSLPEEQIAPTFSPMLLITPTATP